MADVSGQASSLFHRLRSLRRILPLAVSLIGFTYEIVEHGFLEYPVSVPGFLGEILLFAIIGPLLTFGLLTWLMDRVVERDVAEARLATLYEVSRQIAGAQNLDDLQEIALAVPRHAGLTDAASALIVQDGPGQPWLLRRAQGFDDSDLAAVQAALASRQDQPDCAPDAGESGYVKTRCPLLEALSTYLTRPQQLAYGLSLSREPTRRVVMGVYLPPGVPLPPKAAEILEPLATNLALAMDRASLRVHERQLLQQLQRDVATQRLGLTPTFERILADIGADHPIGAAAVYLLMREGSEQHLACTASWPDANASTKLADTALFIMQADGKTPTMAPNLEVASDPGAHDTYVLALPIVDEDEALGVLVLAGQAATRLPHPSILNVVTSMMALLVRNSQLYARLESQAVLEERNHLAREVHDGVAQALGFFNFKVQQVQRLLNRGDLAEARAALDELRSGSQEIYTELRRTIQGLSATPEQPPDLDGLIRAYCGAFASRTGLEVSVDVDAQTELASEVQAELFRVVQEALNNAYRHAHAQRICVRLQKGTNGVTLGIEDDGTGLAPDRGTGDHFGLRMMHQRVQSIGGALEVVSRSGRGTTVRVTIPAETAGQRETEELWSALVS